MATTASLVLLPTVHRSNSDDVSPKASVPRASKEGYFPADITTVDGSGTSVRASDGDESSARKSSISYAADPATAHSSSIGSTDDDASTKVNEVMARKASISSVTFRRPRNPSLPQGNPQHTTGSRIRASSPPHQSRLGSHMPTSRRSLSHWQGRMVSLISSESPSRPVVPRIGQGLGWTGILRRFMRCHGIVLRSGVLYNAGTSKSIDSAYWPRSSKSASVPPDYRRTIPRHSVDGRGWPRMVSRLQT
ncbi:hypothetical protein EDB80DRAFT_105515 [Ilyonectria destructans]|nr:hypothetical protein EDB80DRAFT_105515 [Ilyonectria destructans]